MVLLHNPPTELQNVGDIDTVLEGQDSILEGPFISADCLNTNMFLQHFGVEEDVIEVHTHYTLYNEVLEDVIHHGLDGGQAIGETKEYDKQLEQFLVGPEGCLPLISFLNMHIVVTPPDVQLSEVLHAAEVVDELRDEGEGVTVLYYYGVEYLVVLYQLEGAILLFDEEDWRSHWGLG
ncbi:hypothetical protein E4T56_gene18820 [Termitomyces sp. T112]|nr:hypothetical protein E4T56_gene18820 [Termitomyces sp. T112]